MHRNKIRPIFATSLPPAEHRNCAITGLIRDRGFRNTPAGLPDVWSNARFLGGESRAKPCSYRPRLTVIARRDRHMLSHHERRFLLTQRVGYLATADSRAIPHVVAGVFLRFRKAPFTSPSTRSPKRVTGLALKRVRKHRGGNPMVAIVVDRLRRRTGPRLGWGDVCVDGLRSWRARGRSTIAPQELLRSRYRPVGGDADRRNGPSSRSAWRRVTSWGKPVRGRGRCRP